MQKALLIALILIFTFGLLHADDYFIGSGTSTETYVPLYGYNNYGWSKFFFTDEELIDAGMSGTVSITKIAFQTGGTTPLVNYVTDNQKVYFRYFYDTTYGSSATGYPGTSGYTQVYDGSIVWNGPGWVEITLSIPYSHNSAYGLEILWENRDGSKTAGPPKFCYTSTSSNYRAVYKYSDTSFPTTSGTRYYNRPNIWFTTPTTDVPPPAIAVSPLNGATNFPVQNNLSWNPTGGSPDHYRLWLGTDNPPSNMVSGQIINATSYDPPDYLEYGTTYYWRVVPHNSFGYALDCPIWSFTTLADPTIYTFPYTEGFEGSFNPTGWTDHAGGLTDPITLGADGSSLWAQDDWLNIAGTEKAAALNIWGNVQGWFISPLLNVANDNFVLEFDLALLKYNQPPTGTPPALTGTDDRFAVLIGDGFSWTTANLVREWNNSGSADVLNNISVNGTHVTIPLAGHTGRKRIAFFAGSTTSNADNDIMINNFVVKETLPSPVPSVVLDAEHNSLTISWSAVPGAVIYRVYSAPAPDGTFELIGTSDVPFYQASPTAAKAFYKVIASSVR